MTDIQNWLGRTETRRDTLRLQSAQFMQATLDRPATLREGNPLPPLWHWLYFLEAKPLSELGRDAHPKRGGFLPPVVLPRRMWAGGRISFRAPLILGQAAEKTATIHKISEKIGRSGPLCFVTIRHEISQSGQTVLVEDQDLVFREDPAPDAPQPAPPSAPDDAAFSEKVQPSAVMLFRYSALTFNGHRIHYDVDYARRVEGYQGLVFHGPLSATLLADLAVRMAGKPLTTFSFRGRAPLEGMTPFYIEGRKSEGGLTLWVRRSDNTLAMEARAQA